MIKLFSKIIGVALGVIFLFAGAHIAFGAPLWSGFGTNNNPWSYSYYNGPSQPIQFAEFSTQAECQASYNASTGINKTPCSNNTSSESFANERVAQAVAQDANDSAAEVGPLDKFGLWCGLPLPTLSKYNLTDCIPSVIYYVIYKPASWILVGSGYVFDAMLTLSIDSSFVNQEFVETTWLIVRDFSNMFFIFILIFTGVQTILNMGNWKNTIKLVIIMALLINFSLFFTKVIIDAGNVLAVGIYSSMGMQKTPQEQSFRSVGPVPERNISGNLAGEFEPQRFLDTAGKVDALDATIVFIIAAIVSGFAGYVFFKVALLFIGRLVAFWFLMIVSPFAFISMALPGKANKFQDWLDAIISQAFVAPVFLFLVYLIMQVINGGNGILAGLIKGSPTVGAFTFDKVLGPVIVATIIIMALQKSLEIATDMSRKVGGFVAGIAGQAMGVAGGGALGVATGGTAMLARQTIGRGGAALGEGLGNKLVSSNNALGRWAGRQSLALADKAKTSSFDVRQADGFIGKNINKGLNKGLGAFGVDTKKGMGAIGAKSGKGGYVEGDRQRSQAKEDREHKGAERVEMSDTEKEKMTGVAKEKVAVATSKVASVAAKEKELTAERDTLRKSGKAEPRLADMSKVLEEVKKEREEAEEQLKKAQDEAEEAELKVNVENERRRTQYAKDTSSWFSNKKARVERIEKIRAGRNAEQKKAAKERETGAEKKASEKEKSLKSLAKDLIEAEKEGDSAVIKHIEKKIKKIEEGE